MFAAKICPMMPHGESEHIKRVPALHTIRFELSKGRCTGMPEAWQGTGETHIPLKCSLSRELDAASVSDTMGC